MKPLDRERWDWMPNEDCTTAKVVETTDAFAQVATVNLSSDPNEKAIEIARLTLMSDAPSLLSALIGLYQAYVGMEAATYPDLRETAAYDLIQKYRRINQRLCSERAVN